MSSRATPLPRHYFFTLEDGTWVVQRGIDRVQELLTGVERSYSSLDVSFDIEDLELELLKAQGIVDQYDESFVWLRESSHNELSAAASTLQRALGVAVYYYVQTGLPADYLSLAQARLADIGLDHRYQATELRGQVVIMSANQEPFSLFSSAEDAQTLVAPVMQDLPAHLKVESVRFTNPGLPTEWLEKHASGSAPSLSLVRKLEPKIKLHTVLCVTDEPETHRIVRQVVEALGVEIASAYSGQEGMAMIQEFDPALVIVDLSLPDMHGYEVVAAIRNNPELAQTPIIVLSTLDTDKDRIIAFHIVKAVDYVIKPFQAEQIRRKVWRVLNQYAV